MSSTAASSLWQPRHKVTARLWQPTKPISRRLRQFSTSPPPQDIQSCSYGKSDSTYVSTATQTSPQEDAPALSGGWTSRTPIIAPTENHAVLVDLTNSISPKEERIDSPIDLISNVATSPSPGEDDEQCAKHRKPSRSLSPPEELEYPPTDLDQSPNLSAGPVEPDDSPMNDLPELAPATHLLFKDNTPVTRTRNLTPPHIILPGAPRKKGSGRPKGSKDLKKRRGHPNPRIGTTKYPDLTRPATISQISWENLPLKNKQQHFRAYQINYTGAGVSAVRSCGRCYSKGLGCRFFKEYKRRPVCGNCLGPGAKRRDGLTAQDDVDGTHVDIDANDPVPIEPALRLG